MNKKRPANNYCHCQYIQYNHSLRPQEVSSNWEFKANEQFSKHSFLLKNDSSALLSGSLVIYTRLRFAQRPSSSCHRPPPSFHCKFSATIRWLSIASLAAIAL